MTPSLTNQTASCVRPPRAVLAKGGPLSERMTRESVFAEGALEDGTDLVEGGTEQRLTGEQVAGTGVLDGEGVDADAVAGADPALEVGAPAVVGMDGLLEGVVPRGRAAPTPPAADETGPIEDGARGAGSGPAEVGIGGSEEGDQLLGAEGGVRAFGLDQEVYYLLGCGVVGRARGAAAVEEAYRARRAEAVDELVGGLAADAEVLGESGDRLLPLLPSGDEGFALVRWCSAKATWSLLGSLWLGWPSCYPCARSCVTSLPGLYPL